MKKSTGFLGVLSVAVMGLMASSAQAAVVNSYGSLSGPGVYFGTGNSNGEFTIATDNGIELGLRAKNRQTFELLDGSDGVYEAPLGTYGPGVKQYTSYEFSANTTGYEGKETLSFRLGVDHNPTMMTLFAWVDPTMYWIDNAIAPAGYSGFQNSQNVGFSDTPGGAFNPTVSGMYTFVLEAWAGQQMMDTVTMQVKVGDTVPVPEPGSLALMFGAIGALSLTRRKPA